MKRIRFLSALGLLLAFLTACSVPVTTAPEAKAKVVLFSQQQLQTIAFEMAREKGYFAAENLEVDFKYFASGTTALQTFKAGEGDIVYSGDVPAMRYWADSDKAYRVIAPVERNAKGYKLVTKAAIKGPQDLKGKTVATRVGSSASHFLWAYTQKHNLTDTKIVNMDGPAMISALDRGDIDGFFLWAPFPARAKEVSGAKVHFLTDASEIVGGYYTVLGARPEWIQKNPGVVERFLRAARKGQEFAEQNPEEVKKYLKAKFDLDPAATQEQMGDVDHLLSMDESFYKDFESLSGWLVAENLSKMKVDWATFAYTDALKKIDPKLVAR